MRRILAYISAIIFMLLLLPLSHARAGSSQAISIDPPVFISNASPHKLIVSWYVDFPGVDKIIKNHQIIEPRTHDIKSDQGIEFYAQQQSTGKFRNQPNLVHVVIFRTDAPKTPLKTVTKVVKTYPDSSIKKDKELALYISVSKSMKVSVEIKPAN